MKRLLLTMVLGLLTVSALRGQGQPTTEPMADPTKGVEYFPLVKGTVWTYAAPGGVTVTVTVANHEKIGEIMCARLETKVNGNAVSTEHVTVRDDGVYRVAVGGVKLDKMLCFLKLPAKKGDKWTVNAKIGTETIAGEFETGEDTMEVKVKDPKKKEKVITSVGKNLMANGQPVALAYYFAAGVGVVRQVANIGGVPVDMNLTKFEPGKPPE